ncbi:MAG: type II toxin-antitoxin system VapB family antitoxin [Gemmatimonadetes bacterium]|nr:type II toxin-antitoxin system VapB family antitoxin [Gemmatimonadota bacterium]
MKTTIDIADALLSQARETAAREGTTVRALVEEGLREVLARHRTRRPRFRLRDASFAGEGLQPGVDLADWGAVAAEVYRGRGG